MSDEIMVLTTNDCPGYRVVRVLGTVYGTSAKSRNSFGNLMGGLRQAFGGDQAGYAKLVRTVRDAAIQDMAEQAAQAGANAVLAMRFDSDQLVTDKGLPVNVALAYGTAVVLSAVKT